MKLLRDKKLDTGHVNSAIQNCAYYYAYNNICNTLKQRLNLSTLFIGVSSLYKYALSLHSAINIFTANGEILDLHHKLWSQATSHLWKSTLIVGYDPDVEVSDSF